MVGFENVSISLYRPLSPPFPFLPPSLSLPLILCHLSPSVSAYKVNNIRIIFTG